MAPGDRLSGVHTGSGCDPAARQGRSRAVWVLLLLVVPSLSLKLLPPAHSGWLNGASTPSPHLSNQAPSWLMVSEESLHCAGVIRPYEDAAPGSTLGESTVVSNVRTARAVFARIELTFKGAFSRKKGPKPHRMWPLLVPLLHAVMRCGVTTLTAQISGRRCPDPRACQWIASDDGSLAAVMGGINEASVRRIGPAPARHL